MNRRGSGRAVAGLAAMTVCACTILAVRSPALLAQDKPQAGAPATMTPLKVTVVISRFQGEKKTSNLPFTLSVNTSQRTNLRMGADVPVPQANMKEGTSYSYRPVGTQIDVNAGAMLDSGQVAIQLTVSDTQLSVDNSPEAGSMRGLPRFHNFTSSATLMLRDGQTIQYTAATDKTSGEVIKLDVTLNVLK